MQLLINKFAKAYNSLADVMFCGGEEYRLTVSIMTQAYVFTGAVGSGRHEVMADLISWSAHNHDDHQKYVVLLPKGENNDTGVVFKDIAEVMEWDGTGEEASIPEIPDDVTDVFILLNGIKDPVDQIENLTNWFRQHPNVELARIITVLNSRLACEKSGLKLWFDACVHFSDVVLFNKREGVPNKWFSDFKGRFVKECYPCLFELVKENRVHNPAEVLFPETRRMSLVFDYLDEEIPVAKDSADEPEYEIVDETEDEEGVVIDEDDDEDDKPEIDKYFELDVAGRRRIRIPDISAYLN